MAADAGLLEFLNDQLRGLGHVTMRRMFSGAGVYCNGVIFALFLGDTL
jgi:DNA transformation protein and related proteins